MNVSEREKESSEEKEEDEENDEEEHGEEEEEKEEESDGGEKVNELSSCHRPDKEASGESERGGEEEEEEEQQEARNEEKDCFLFLLKQEMGGMCGIKTAPVAEDHKCTREEGDGRKDRNDIIEKKEIKGKQH